MEHILSTLTSQRPKAFGVHRLELSRNGLLLELVGNRADLGRERVFLVERIQGILYV